MATRSTSRDRAAGGPSRLKPEPLALGWREWVWLPELCPFPIKAKIDTGAKTSAIHAFGINVCETPDGRYVDFVLHPVQRRRLPECPCRARVQSERTIRSSNGARQTRAIIKTPIRIGGRAWPIELSLTNRDEMGFRVLLGRDAIRRGVIVHPGKSYLQGKI